MESSACMRFAFITMNIFMNWHTVSGRVCWRQAEKVGNNADGDAASGEADCSFGRLVFSTQGLAPSQIGTPPQLGSPTLRVRDAKGGLRTCKVHEYRSACGDTR